MGEKINLNETDFKLLSYLYHHNREPLTKIAKATKLTRQQVEYRIENYVSSGLIKQFATIINYSLIGLKKFAILLLKTEKYESLESVKIKLRNNKNCISFGEFQGEFDLYVDIICEDEKKLIEVVKEITEKSKSISNYLLITPYLSEVYPVKFTNKKTDLPFVLVQDEKEVISLTTKEKEILKVLASDSRISLADLSKKCDISIERAFHMVKRLKKSRVIQGTKIVFNMDLLGYSYSLILFNVTGYSTSLQNDLKEFCTKHPFVNSLGLSINNPNCFIQVFHKSNEEFRETFKDLKKFLDKYYVEYKILNVLEEEQVNTFPLF